MNLTLEINSKEKSAKVAAGDKPIIAGAVAIMMTPAIGEDFWLARVKVSERQAVVCFPKFGTIGIGFQHEDSDWNTNLPYTCDTTEIYEHIKVNRRGAKRDKCIAAIKVIQAHAVSLKG